jgi:exoribonuclease R
MIISKHNWIAGTLELSSKVRYGMTARGVPIFRFIPYDKRFPPLAVGSSQRNLFHNIHAIVEPHQQEAKKGELQKANIIQTLGQTTADTETQLLLATYAYDSRKEMKCFPLSPPPPLALPLHTKRHRLNGHTFNIDPPGCKDVDDTFTVNYDASTYLWSIAINIADVAHHILEGSPLDKTALERATSFYTPQGEAIYPMLPREISESSASLIKSDEYKPTVSLCLTYSTDTKIISNVTWQLTESQTHSSYTYDEAQNLLKTSPDILVLQDLCETLAPNSPKSPDTHTIVERLMIFYNQTAALLLFNNKTGVLRRHKKADDINLISIPGIPEFIAFEAAEFCLPTDNSIEHFSLDKKFYTYASSPLRRYVDLVNQRAMKSLLTQTPALPQSQALVDEMNRRQKQAKAFSRDLFFMTTLSQNQEYRPVDGIVLEQKEGGFKTEIWVPDWKRVIKAKSINQTTFSRGTKVKIQWYEARDQPRWKDRIVFNVKGDDSENPSSANSRQ